AITQENEKRVQTAMAQERQLFELRKTLGQATLADELAFIDRLLEKTKAGSDQRTQLEIDRANKARQIHDTRENVAANVLGDVGQLFGIKPTDQVTAGSIEAMFARLTGARERVRSAFAAGGAVPFGALTDSLRANSLERQMRDVLGLPSQEQETFGK